MSESKTVVHLHNEILCSRKKGAPTIKPYNSVFSLRGLERKTYMKVVYLGM